MRRSSGAGRSARAWLAVTLAVLLAAAVPLVMAPAANAAALAPPGAVVAMTTPRATLADPTTGDVFVSADNSVYAFGADGSLLAQIPNVYGASGLALDGGGNLWVAESSDAKLDQISLSTLAITNTYATGIPVGGSIAIIDGGVWFASSSGLGRFDLTSHATSTRGSVSSASDSLYAVPGSHRLIDAQLGYSPSTAYLYDISVNPVTLVTSSGVGTNLRQLAVSADGSHFWSASGGVYSLPEYTTSTLTTDGVTYPATYYPAAVAYSPAHGGVVAVGTQSSDQLYVSSVGTPVSTHVYSLTGDLAYGQVAVSSDGGRAYALATASGGYTLDTFSLAPSISLALPSSVVANVPTAVAVTGTGLGVVSSITVGGVAATFTRTSTTQLTVTMPSGVPVGTQPLVVTTPFGSASTNLTVTSNTGATLSGTVRSDGSPLPGASLTLSGGPLVSPRTTTSGAAGAYSFTGLAFGTTYSLSVHDPAGTEPDQVLPGITLTPDLTTSLDVDMQALPTPAGPVLARQSLAGAAQRVVVDPTTGRVFVSAGNEVDAFDADGNLLARFQNQYAATGLAINGSTLYVNLPTSGSITEINMGSLQIIGSLATNTTTDGSLAFAGGKLFFTGGNDQWVSLDSLDPTTLATSTVSGNWYVPTLGPVPDNPNLFLAWTTGLSPGETEVINGATNTALQTFGGSFNVPGPAAASSGANLVWTADGIERHLADLSTDGVTYPTSITYPGTGSGAVSYSSGHGGVLDFGADVDLYGAPAVADQLPDSPTNSAFGTNGDRLYYTTSDGHLVVYDLHPYLTSVGTGTIYTDATSLALAGQNLGSATAVTIDGTSVPFSVAGSGALNLTVSGLTAGSHAVAVTTRWGTSSSLSFSAAVRPPLPVVTGVSPATLSTTGGSVVITGSHLTGATSVRFAGVAASSFAVKSDTEIDAVVGPHTALLGLVAVTTGGGTNSSGPTFAWVAPLPVVSSLTPSSGPAAGGSAVTIHGTGFLYATGVSFGGTAASFSVSNDTTIVATAPAHAAGSATVAVTTAGGTSTASAGNAYLFQVPLPAVVGLTPNSGSAAGGYQVVITGTGLTGAFGVAFGGVPASSFVAINDTTVVAVAPAHAAGSVSVAVTTPGGTSQASSPSLFTYTAIPTGTIIGTVSSSAGPLAGMLVIISPNTGLTVQQAVTTAADGSFSLSGLPVGSYRLLVMDPSTFFGASTYYISQWYEHGGASLDAFATATDINVGAGATVTLHPIVLSYNQPGTLSGTVSSTAGPLSNMAVAVYNTASSAVVTYTSTDSTGHYTVTGLAPGTYRVAALDWAQVLGSTSYYVSQFYAHGGTADTGWATATNVTISAGSTTTLADISLTYNHPGSVSGTVRSSSGPLAGMLVEVFNTSSSAALAYTTTDASGHYSLGGLAPGTYRVAVADWAQVLGLGSYWISQFYGGGGTIQTGWASATNVPVTAGTATTVPDVTLVHTP